MCAGSGLSHGTVRDTKPSAARPVQVLLCVGEESRELLK